MPDSETPASKCAGKAEAALLFRLAQKEGSIEGMRQLILPERGSTDSIAAYRRDVLRFFDEFAAGRTLSSPKVSRTIRRSRRQRRFRPKGRPRILSDAQLRDANQALESGSSWSDVAARFQVSKMTLLRYCRKSQDRQSSGWPKKRRRFVPLKERAPYEYRHWNIVRGREISKLIARHWSIA